MAERTPGSGTTNNPVDGVTPQPDAGGRTNARRYADKEIQTDERGLRGASGIGKEIYFRTRFGTACERIYELTQERDALIADLAREAEASERATREWIKGFGVIGEEVLPYMAEWRKLRAEFLKGGRG